MNWKDTLYIAYRCGKAEFSRVVFRIEALLHSIQPGKVVFCSTEGMGGYGDNPKAIAEKLHADHPEYELVWLVNDMRKTFPPYIRKAPNTLWSRAYEYATAKIWVDCHRKPWGTRKRRGQYYLQTFHCNMCFKPLGADRGGKMPKIGELVSRADSSLIDIWLTSSGWNEAMVRRAMYYTGRMERVGSPRCDILFRDSTTWRQRIREQYGIPQKAHILLFAPTFRAGSQARQRTVEAERVQLDFQAVLDALAARTGGKWYLLLRLHPQVAAHLAEYPLVDKNVQHVADASQYGDAYELLAASDALLTDYSSLAFDAGFIAMPVFLYADDLASYQSDRNRLYFNMYETPFPFAETEQALLQNIQNFNQTVYRQHLQSFFVHAELLEDGHTSARTQQIIMDLLQGHNKEKQNDSL